VFGSGGTELVLSQVELPEQPSPVLILPYPETQIFADVQFGVAETQEKKTDGLLLLQEAPALPDPHAGAEKPAPVCSIHWVFLFGRDKGSMVKTRERQDTGGNQKPASQNST